MQQTKKGNQWHLWMKGYIGVDAESGLAYRVGTAPNVNNVAQAQALLHCNETDVLGDAGYQSVENLGVPVVWYVAMMPGKRRALPKTLGGQMMEWIEHANASNRAKVEHPFHVVKNLFRHRKTRYRDFEKNSAQFLTLFGFANLVLARKWLLVPHCPRCVM